MLLVKKYGPYVSLRFFSLQVKTPPGPLPIREGVIVRGQSGWMVAARRVAQGSSDTLGDISSSFSRSCGATVAPVGLGWGVGLTEEWVKREEA